MKIKITNIKIVTDILNVDPRIIKNMTFNKTSILTLLEQRFAIGQKEMDMLKEEGNWKQFVPHENSGPCYTYDPPHESDPGYDISLYMKMNSNKFDDNLQVFLHKKSQFFYATKHNYNMLYLDHNTLQNTQLSHPRAIRKIFYDSII